MDSNIKSISEKINYKVQKSSYRWNHSKPGAYFIVVDTLGKKIVVKNNRNFSILEDKDLFPGFIKVNDTLAEMLMSKDKDNRSVVKEILDIQWNEKYGENAIVKDKDENIGNSIDNTLNDLLKEHFSQFE